MFDKSPETKSNRKKNQGFVFVLFVLMWWLHFQITKSKYVFKTKKFKCPSGSRLIPTQGSIVGNWRMEVPDLVLFDFRASFNTSDGNILQKAEKNGLSVSYFSYP